jgi:hypothetical protein
MLVLASNELGQNSFAMAGISKELVKRKWFPVVILITLDYLLQGFTIHSVIKRLFKIEMTEMDTTKIALVLSIITMFSNIALFSITRGIRFRVLKYCFCLCNIKY